MRKMSKREQRVAISICCSSDDEFERSLMRQQQPEAVAEEEEEEEDDSNDEEDFFYDDDDEHEREEVDEDEEDYDAYNKITDLLRRGENMDAVKLEECKAYFKRHGLRRSGNKAVCIERILEHWRIKDGKAAKLYPVSSFFINCKGDVCKGDIILFKQRVYQKGRSGVKIIGIRRVAGRVVNESYGADKQQHTFTVEVFWSKGTNELPTLFPLLVKGRNLYRLMTFRQPWSNEAERLKVLEEKHERGATARHIRTIARSAKQVSKHLKAPDTKKPPPKRYNKGTTQAASGHMSTHCGTDHCDVNAARKQTIHGKKRMREPFSEDPPTKKYRKELDQAATGQNKTYHGDSSNKGTHHNKAQNEIGQAACGQKSNYRGNAQSGRHANIKQATMGISGRISRLSSSHMHANFFGNAAQLQEPFIQRMPAALQLYYPRSVVQSHDSRRTIAVPYHMVAPYMSGTSSYPFSMPSSIGNTTAIPDAYFAPR